MTEEDLMEAIECEIENPMVLNSREVRVLRGRFVERRTLQDVALEIGLTRERVRQLQKLGVRKLAQNWKMQELIRNVDLNARIGFEDLHFGFRASNALIFAGYETLADLLKATEKDLLSLRNFGRGSLDIVRAGLKKMGLALAEPPAPRPKVEPPSRREVLVALRKIERQAEDLLKAVRRLAAEMTD